MTIELRYNVHRVGDFFEVFDWEEKETVYVREGPEGEEECNRVKDNLNEKDIFGLNFSDPEVL